LTQLTQHNNYTVLLSDSVMLLIQSSSSQEHTYFHINLQEIGLGYIQMYAFHWNLRKVILHGCFGFDAKFLLLLQVAHIRKYDVMSVRLLSITTTHCARYVCLCTIRPVRSQVPLARRRLYFSRRSSSGYHGELGRNVTVITIKGVLWSTIWRHPVAYT